MLTIKHVEENGHESVVPVLSVSFDADKHELTGLGAPDAAGTQTGSIRYSTGHAFVMNENGSTIGVYNMRIKK